MPAKAKVAAKDLKALDARVGRLTFAKGKAGPAPAPRIRRILVALDGSLPSRVGLEWAAQWAKALGAAVHLVAVTPKAPPYASEWAQLVEMEAQSEGQAKQVLAEAKATLARRGIKAATHLEHGTPVARIVAASKAHQADLVVLGALGNRGPLGLGSVADGVRHRVKASVLIARNPPPAQGVLAATDGSAPSRSAVALAFEMSRLAGDRLTVLHAVDLPLFGDAPRAFAAGSQKAHGVVDDLRREDPSGHAKYELVHGAAGPAILHKARDDGAGLVVVGSRGRGGVRSLLLGSVSDRVSRDAPCSVLVVKS